MIDKSHLLVIRNCFVMADCIQLLVGAAGFGAAGASSAGVFLMEGGFGEDATFNGYTPVVTKV